MFRWRAGLKRLTVKIGKRAAEEKSISNFKDADAIRRVKNVVYIRHRTKMVCLDKTHTLPLSRTSCQADLRTLFSSLLLTITTAISHLKKRLTLNTTRAAHFLTTVLTHLGPPHSSERRWRGKAILWSEPDLVAIRLASRSISDWRFLI